ncbi:MAG: hypothetical protein ACLQFR_19395 [Streptosporangiaceae bacterium]
MTPTADVRKLQPGSRWRSAVCQAEVVVVRAPAGAVCLRIGGADVLASDAAPLDGARLDAALADGTLLGKRYHDEVSGLEVLCTKSGTGTITVDGRRVTVMTPKRLPASD